MRWDNLFADLEGQLGAATAAERDVAVAEMTRAERASLTLAARLWAATEATVTVTLTDGQHCEGMVRDGAQTWVLLALSPGQALIPLHAVSHVAGLGTHADASVGVARQLSFGHALRALSRDRVRVAVHTAAGAINGIIASVGRDFCDVIDTDRRDHTTTVSIAAIVCVRSAGPLSA